MNERITTEMLYIKSMKPHFHREELELLLVLKGSLTLFRMEQQLEITEGQFTIINSRNVHHIISNGAYVLSTRIRLSEFCYIYERMEYVDFLNRDEIPETQHSLNKRLGMAIIGFMITDYQLKGKPEFSGEKEFYENQLVHLLFKSYQAAFSMKKEDSYMNRDTMDRYYSIVEYIVNHIHEKINAENVLQMVYMHPTYFSQFMKKVGGIGFKDLLSYHKLAEIEMLLLQEEYSISDIADLVHFIDKKAFYHVFKKYFHTSPSKWREQLFLVEQDYQVIEEPNVLNAYISSNHIVQRENRMARIYRYLDTCRKNGVDLHDMEIVIDPYADITDAGDMEFQPYKYSTPLFSLIRDMGARVTLLYPVKLMRSPEHQEFLIESINGFYRANGETELKKWRFILQVEDSMDADLARTLQQRLQKAGLIHVNIMMTGMNTCEGNEQLS